MKTLEKGQEKIKKICEVLRDETLEPAQKEAQRIIEEAKQQASEIIAEAKKSSENFMVTSKASLEQEKKVFQSTMVQASKQALEALRQSIENKFFDEHLSSIIEKGASDPKLVANLVNTIVKALEKDGLNSDLTAVVAKTIDARQINELLLQEVLNSLKEKSVTLGGFAAGAQVKLQGKNLTIDMTNNALRDLLSSYVTRSDFRKLIFSNHS